MNCVEDDCLPTVRIEFHKNSTKPSVELINKYKEGS